MFRRTLSILIILIIFNVANAAVNITCEFANEDNDYVAKLSNQTFTALSKGMKIYGRHAFSRTNAHVTVLDASYKSNNLEIVPTTLMRIFTNLKEVRLEKVGLIRLTSDSFKYCQKVINIKFADDNVKIGANAFKQCRNLETLRFYDNDLSVIDNMAFFGLENLKSLTLEKCKLNSALKLNDLLQPLRKLEEINLSGNYFKHFPEVALTNLPFLKKINMSHNELTSFSSLNVKPVIYLEMLDLNNNSISSLDRQFLENWNNNAALDMRSNECINKSFESLGTEKNPMFEVVNDFMKCFDDIKTIAIITTIATTTTNGDDDDSESKETESTTISLSPPLKKVDEKPDMSKILHKLIENERKAAQLNVTHFTKDVDVKQNASIANVKPNATVVDPVKKDAIEMTGSPFDFAKNDTKIGEKEIKDDATEVNANATTSTEPTNAPKIQIPKVVITKPDGKNSSESESDEADSEIADNSVTSTTELPTTTTTAATKKSKRKHRKNKLKKTLETIIEEPANTTLNVPTAIEIPASNISTLTSLKPKDFLHDYEQAACRFYVDQHHNYNCVLYNVTHQLKRINVKHLGDYKNENVSSVHFRDSSLVHVPKFLTQFFPNLTHLSIENTTLKVMDNDFIEDCGKIKTINVSNNKIRRIERDSLKQCINLEHVDLSGNPIETIEGGIFECNPKLSISINALKILPAHIKNENEKQAVVKNEVKNQ